MAKPKSPCPICRKEALSRAENPSFPFCCSRCKLVDLGQWLNEGYRLPAEDEGAEGEPTEDAPSRSEPS
jgi:uncharacterized protein